MVVVVVAAAGGAADDVVVIVLLVVVAVVVAAAAAVAVAVSVDVDVDHIAGLLLLLGREGVGGDHRGRQEPKTKSNCGSPLLYRPYNLWPKPALNPEPEKLNSNP